MNLDNEHLTNVVSFPTAGKITSKQDLDDPLQDLLDEFGDIDDQDSNSWEDIEDDETGETTVEMVLGQDFKKSSSIVQMLQQLDELQKRKEHFTKEIETFLPKKHR